MLLLLLSIRAIYAFRLWIPDAESPSEDEEEAQAQALRILLRVSFLEELANSL